MDSRKCANCGEYLLDRAWQHQCGDRFCGDCYTALKYILLESGRCGGAVRKECPLCDEAISPHGFFRDRAVENELKTATIECTNQYCTWQGPGELYKEHIKTCVWTKVPCPNKFCGCPRRLLRKELDQHLRTGCLFAGKCPWCLETVDNLIDHYKKGCGEGKTLAKKNNEFSMAAEIEQLSGTVSMIETTIHQLQGLTQVQATSTRVTFIWKITEVQRRNLESDVVSLYSAPFYTGHPGYKLCLRVYLNGDGSGKDTHISFFLILMKGEYDALLPWPFKQKVTLMLLNQDRSKKDIVQSFKPDPSSSSFQRPVREMNIASGCPQFDPWWVLRDPSFIKDDVLYIKCIVDTSDLPKIS